VLELLLMKFYIVRIEIFVLFCSCDLDIRYSMTLMYKFDPYALKIYL